MYSTVTVNLFQKNKVFTLNLGMANPNLLIFVGNAEWKLAKLLKNNDYYSNFHSTTVTATLFEIAEMLPENHLEYGIKCFSSILVWVIQIHQHV